MNKNDAEYRLTQQPLTLMKMQKIGYLSWWFEDIRIGDVTIKWVTKLVKKLILDKIFICNGMDEFYGIKNKTLCWELFIKHKSENFFISH